MKNQNIIEKRNNAAKEFMLVWMSDGKIYKPGDFDDIVGGMGSFPLTGRPTWNYSVFFYALAHLITEKKIYYWRMKGGAHCYQINNGQDKPKTTYRQPVSKERRAFLKLSPEKQEEERIKSMKELKEAWASLGNAIKESRVGENAILPAK